MIGVLVIIASATIVIFSRQIADFLGGSDYDARIYKKWAAIGTLVGIAIMLNLHYFILSGILGLFFKK